MKVHVSSHLHDYTGHRSTVQAEGATLNALLDDLDEKFPGIRFRVVDEQDEIRRHIKLFVNGSEVDRLSKKLAPSDEVHVLAALSGG